MQPQFRNIGFFSLTLLPLILFTCSTGKKKVTVYYDDGSPKSEQFFGNDSLIKEITYYENHTKRYEGEYRNGLRNGHWIYWFDNGKIWSEGYFKMGENDSIHDVYHPNGNKYYSDKYHNGKRAGIWKFWDIDGNFVKQIDYGR